MKRNIMVSLSMIFLLGCQIPQKKILMDQEVREMLDTPGETPSGPSNGADLSKISEALAPLPEINKAMAQKRFDIAADQVPAKTFFLSLVQDTPYNITVHPKVEGAISLQLKKVSIPEILETIRNVYGFDYRQTPQGIEVLPATLQTRAFSVDYLDINRVGKSGLQVSATSLSAGTASGGAPASGGSTDAGGTSSQVSSSTTTDFWKELTKTVETIIGSGDGRKVAISPLSSLIVVQAMPDELKKVEEFLKRAQISLNRQVILEAKIIEVQLNKAYQAGINWGLISGRMNVAQMGSSDVAGSLANATGNVPVKSTTFPGSVNMKPGAGTTTLSGGSITPFGGIVAMAVNYKNISTFVELLEGQGSVHVLSNPRVSTLNNQPALIKAGDDEFFITNVSTTVTSSGTGSTSTPNVTFTPFFSGVSLHVTPQITGNNDVTLHIHPTISDVTSNDISYTLTTPSSTGGDPVTTKTTVPLAKSTVRESDNIVKARNGELVIIGGLIQNKTVDIKEGVPVLGKLPIIGGLFNQKSQSTQKSEIVILIRPIVAEAGVASLEADKGLSRIQDINEEIMERE